MATDSHAWAFSDFSDDERNYEPAAALLSRLRAEAGGIAGRYRIEGLLGTGNAGFVVAARHAVSQKPVRLKILRAPRPQAVAPGLQAMESTHVARLIETGHTRDGSPFIATERFEGRTLAEELAERGRLPVDEAVRWILEICEALAEAHALGIVHGALKPQNVLLCPAAADGAVKVLDFGMPSPVEAAESGDGGTWFSSPAYLAPEQVLEPDKLSPKADLWAVGVLLYQLISGGLPFDADSVSGMLVAVACDEAALLSTAGVPLELARVIQKCLAKDHGKRPGTASSLARRLAPFAGPAGNDLLAQVTAAARRGAIATRAGAGAGAVPSANGDSDADAANGAIAMTVADDDADDVDAALPVDAITALLRRRVRTAALIAFVAVLVIAGLAAPRSSPRLAGNAAPMAPVIELPADVERESRAQIPPPEPEPEPEAEPEPLVSPAASTTTSSQPASRRPDPKVKPLSPLIVRDNPYRTNGFTHPTRLGSASR